MGSYMAGCVTRLLKAYYRAMLIDKSAPSSLIPLPLKFLILHAENGAVCAPAGAAASLLTLAVEGGISPHKAPVISLPLDGGSCSGLHIHTHKHIDS